MDVPRVAAALAEAVGALPGARLQIDIHHEVFRPDAHCYAPEVGAGLRHLAANHDAVELREHDYFTDDELWDYLTSLDVSVLPYRFGTHSGWLEACRDVGTAVVAPSCGYYADQGPVQTYGLDEDVFDEPSLHHAVRRAVESDTPTLTVAERERQRLEVAVAHRQLYESLLG
jgi:hypothetical protein